VPVGSTLSSSGSGRPSPFSLVQSVDALGGWGPGGHLVRPGPQARGGLDKSLRPRGCPREEQDDPLGTAGQSFRRKG
jgi:hypothetical protein